MSSVLYKIFSNNSDEEVHAEFLKFSRGAFENRYLIEAKKQKDKWSIKTSSEFANYLVKKCLEKIKDEIEVKGVIVSTLNLGSDEEIGFKIEKRKNFMGIRQLVVNTKTSPDKILNLMNKYPRAFFALSFSVNGCGIKIKAKAPKSVKPAGKGEKEVKADFCSIKTSDKSIIEDLFFDSPQFDEIRIKHTIKINEIILPKGVEDPVRIRELSERKGVMFRHINIDGKEKTEEKEFIV